MITAFKENIQPAYVDFPSHGNEFLLHSLHVKINMKTLVASKIHSNIILYKCKKCMEM